MGEQVTAVRQITREDQEQEEARNPLGPAWLDTEAFLGRQAGQAPAQTPRRAQIDPVPPPPFQPVQGDEDAPQKEALGLEAVDTPSEEERPTPLMPELVLTPAQQSAMPYVAMRNLTLRQRQAALLMGQHVDLTLAQVAAQVGVGKGVLSSWHSENPWFRALVEWEFGSAAEAARQFLGLLVGDAIRTYQDILRTSREESMRFKVAKDILDRLGVTAPLQVHVLSQSAVMLRQVLGIEDEKHT